MHSLYSSCSNLGLNAEEARLYIDLANHDIDQLERLLGHVQQQWREGRRNTTAEQLILEAKKGLQLYSKI